VDVEPPVVVDVVEQPLEHGGRVVDVVLPPPLVVVVVNGPG
jgi:hypothetical protein